MFGDRARLIGGAVSVLFLLAVWQLDPIVRCHLEMRLELRAQLGVPVFHDSLSRGFARMPLMASTSRSQRDRSETSWRRPAAVSR